MPVRVTTDQTVAPACCRDSPHGLCPGGASGAAIDGLYRQLLPAAVPEYRSHQSEEVMASQVSEGSGEGLAARAAGVLNADLSLHAAVLEAAQRSGDPAPAENLIHAGWSSCTGGPDVVRDSGRRGARATGERCGMVMDRAAATGLPWCDERVRAAAAAADEQPGQTQRSSRCATSSRSCSGNSVRTGYGSPRVTGRCWRRCCTGSRGTCSSDCTWWCARIPCSAGTAMR